MIPFLLNTLYNSCTLILLVLSSTYYRHSASTRPFIFHCVFIYVHFSQSFFQSCLKDIFFVLLVLIFYVHWDQIAIACYLLVGWAYSAYVGVRCKPKITCNNLIWTSEDIIRILNKSHISIENLMIYQF